MQHLLLEMFEVHLLMSKLNAHPLEGIQLEHATKNCLSFWNSDTTQEDLLLTDIDDDLLSAKILNKLVHEKKKKQALSDELEQMVNTISQTIGKMMINREQTIDELVEVLQRYNK